MSLSARALKLLVLLALVAIVGVWVSELAFLWHTAALALALAFTAEWQLVMRRKVDLVRELPARAELGHEFALSYQLKNPLSRVRFAEPVPLSAGGDALRGELDRTQRMVTRKLRALALGEITFGPVHTALLGPLGLLWWPNVLPMIASVTVEPADLRQAGNALPNDPGAQRAMKAPGDGSEHYGHRPYAPGDQLRSIDWKASAKTNQTMVRLRERDEQLELAILLDLSISAERNFGEARAEHLRINGAARMAEWALLRGERVSVIAYADQVLRASWDLHGAAGLRKLKGAFAGLNIVPKVAHPLSAAHALKVHLKRRALVIWFTDAGALSHERGLLRALKLLATKHLSLVACPIDPKIRELQLDPGSDWHAPNRRLAAEALQRRVDLAQAELRALGVIAVFEHPDRLSRATFDAYARLKARRAV